MSDFDSAELYAVGDVEILEHESPESALEEYFDDCYPMVPDGAVIVEGYVHEQVPETWAPRAASRAVEHIVEELDEEYGGPEARGPNMFDHGGLAELESRIRDAIQHAIECHFTPWTCRKVGQREYSRDEVKALYAEMFADEEPSR